MFSWLVGWYCDTDFFLGKFGFVGLVVMNSPGGWLKRYGWLVGCLQNFVGLSVADGYIACGSESNSVSAKGSNVAHNWSKVWSRGLECCWGGKGGECSPHAGFHLHD